MQLVNRTGRASGVYWLDAGVDWGFGGRTGRGCLLEGKDLLYMRDCFVAGRAVKGHPGRVGYSYGDGI